MQCSYFFYDKTISHGGGIYRSYNIKYSCSYKHINKILLTWCTWCLNKEHKQSWRQHKCSFIEHPLYPGQPIWRAFKIFKFRPSSLSKISINYLAGYFIKISTCFSGPVSSLFLVSLMCHPLQYFSLLWLACDHFFIFFSHFALLSLCKACRRTQSFLGQFLGHIYYLKLFLTLLMFDVIFFFGIGNEFRSQWQRDAHIPIISKATKRCLSGDALLTLCNIVTY